MSAIVFFGDEATAAGFRLTGVEIGATDPAQLQPALSAARETADILIVTTDMARHLPAGWRNQMEVWTRPLVVFVPDARGRADMPDLEADVRRVLGIEV